VIAGVTPAVVAARTPASHRLNGSTTTMAGRLISGTGVLLLESLDAAKTDGTGKFELRTAARGPVTLIARHIGYAPATVNVPVDVRSVIPMLRARPAKPQPITVESGADTPGSKAV
jgi:hypothetical protein